MRQIVIVGSGIAGLVAALELCGTHAVTLVTKAKLAESNTRYAQGGIAAVMSSDDSVEEHVADTLRAGAGLCDPEAVRILCAEGPSRVRDLIALGVAFDRHAGELARGLEAAHTRPRVLHAGGDATGLSIELALARAVRAREVRVLEDTFAADLVMRQGQVAGLAILNAAGERIVLQADAVILASGGAGQLYRHTTNPAVATGDGVAMAFRAGAQLADVEFYQFHPTALALPGSFLISEAVRGDGAVLRDASGRRFMQGVHPLAELAPRDVVARGIAAAMAAQGGRPVLLDATAMGSAFLARRFPTIDAACRQRGLDWANEPIPVTPAAHYWMGGIRTDTWGRTSLPGLFAIGEVACTGVHGANRLASNSLLESAVFAWRCANRLLATSSRDAFAAWPASVPEDTLRIQTEPLPAPDATALGRQELQHLMWSAAGIEREQSGLEHAAAQLKTWRGQAADAGGLETRNLLTLAQVVVGAALARPESRGAHYRKDYPRTSASWQRSIVVAAATPVAVAMQPTFAGAGARR